MTGLYIDEKAGLPFLALLLIFVAFRFFMPAGFWMQVTALDVHDAARWQDVTVDFQRTYLRDFDGAWRAEVWQQTPGGEEVICSTDWKPHGYRVEATLPEPVTLEWMTYTDERCFQLTEPGNYEVEVNWIINPGSLLFERNLRRSDTFTIFGAP